jgi:hypothetical protein
MNEPLCDFELSNWTNKYTQFSKCEAKSLNQLSTRVSELVYGWMKEWI